MKDTKSMVIILAACWVALFAAIAITVIDHKYKNELLGILKEIEGYENVARHRGAKRVSKRDRVDSHAKMEAGVVPPKD